MSWYQKSKELWTYVLKFSELSRKMSVFGEDTIQYRQGMTDRRSRDARSERRSLFRDREVIADLHFKK